MVHQISAAEAAARLASGAVRVIDVRTPEEFEFVAVPGGEFLSPELLDALRLLPKDTPLAFLCHHGVRSHQAAAWFAQQGFSRVHNVVGGIEAWAVEVDRSLPRY